jgi:hypothetical protein
MTRLLRQKVRGGTASVSLLVAMACTSSVDVDGSVFLADRDRGATTFPLVIVNVYDRSALRSLTTSRAAQLEAIRSAGASSDSAAQLAMLSSVLTDSLPTAAITATTDADGRFPLRLRAGTEYLVVARALNTRVASAPQTVEWFVWFTPSADSTRLLLANNNLTGTAVGRAAKEKLGRLVLSEAATR